jgi:type I restriction-modification system DNA methylase subunit
MSNQFFDKPILNSPYVAPAQHWELDKEGQPTQRVTNTMRTAEYVSPIPKLKERKGADRAAELRGDYILANGSMSSNQSGEGDIRKALVEADLEDCLVALPGQLFYSTQIPVCLWFLAKNKAAGKCRAMSELDLAFVA